MDQSFIRRETVGATYSPQLASELLKGPARNYYDTHFCHNDDCMFVWGAFEHDDPSYIYMVKLYLPGEA